MVLTEYILQDNKEIITNRGTSWFHIHEHPLVVVIHSPDKIWSFLALLAFYVSIQLIQTKEVLCPQE